MVTAGGLLAAGLLVEAVYDVMAGPDAADFVPIDDWLHDALILAAAVICARGARRRPSGPDRRGWWFISAGLVVFGAAEILWGVLFPDGIIVPKPNVTDVLYLSTYPLFMAGLVLLVRGRLPSGQWHRWLDGLVLALIVATPGVTLVVVPVLRRAPLDPLGQAVAVSYPLGDILLVGALLGALPLMRWRPDGSWRWLSLGLLLFTAADSIYAVATVEATSHQGPYDFLWSAGSLAIALGSTRPDRGPAPPSEVTGWPGIALPLGAQLFAVGTQVYGYFHEVPPAERLLTIAVLGIGIAQIITARDRPDRPPSRPASDASPRE